MPTTKAPTRKRAAKKAVPKVPANVHRPLTRGDKGEDVKQLQHGINHKAASWKLPQYAVDVDGEYGELTEGAAEKLLYALGVAGKPMRAAKQGTLSEYAQRLLRGSRPRTKAVQALAKVRAPRVTKWRRGGLGARAVQIATTLVGVMEEGGNNTGPKVSEIIRSNGGTVGEPWCGDFVAFCYRLAGSKVVSRSWASVALLGSVLGLKTTTHPELGDIVRYVFDHTGLFVRWLNPGDEGYTGPGDFEAIEGNTGPTGAVSDSATGGDGVYRKVRNVSAVSNFRHVTR